MQITDWLRYSERQHTIQTALAAAVRQKNLALNEFYVLYFLGQAPHQQLRLNELEARIELSQSALSRMISRLENKDCGVIERLTCIDDKRGSEVKLTTNGQQLLQQVQDSVEHVLLNYEK